MMSDIHWRDIGDMRNRLAHDYEGSDIRFFWETATGPDIDEIKRICLTFCEVKGLDIELLATRDVPRQERSRNKPVQEMAETLQAGDDRSQTEDRTKENREKPAL